MNKAFILVDKSKPRREEEKGDDYSSIQKEKVFLFTHIPPHCDNQTMADYTALLSSKLDQADETDVLVLNGPSWIIGLAGFLWLNQEHRKTMGFLVFNNS